VAPAANFPRRLARFTPRNASQNGQRGDRGLTASSREPRRHRRVTLASSPGCNRGVVTLTTGRDQSHCHGGAPSLSPPLPRRPGVAVPGPEPRLSSCRTLPPSSRLAGARRMIQTPNSSVCTASGCLHEAEHTCDYRDACVRPSLVLTLLQAASTSWMAGAPT
jgi:hypothetical protein